MIRGFFERGRPYVRARVAIDLARPDGSILVREADIDFLLDTGADVSAIGVRDLTRQLGVPLSATVEEGTYASFGEAHIARTIPGFVFLQHEVTGRHSGFYRSLLVPTGAPEEFDVSILGCDIILQGELRLNAHTVELDLPVLGA